MKYLGIILALLLTGCTKTYPKPVPKYQAGDKVSWALKDVPPFYAKVCKGKGVITSFSYYYNGMHKVPNLSSKARFVVYGIKADTACPKELTSAVPEIWVEKL